MTGRLFWLVVLALASCGQAPAPRRPFGPQAPPVIAPYLPAGTAAGPAQRAKAQAALERALHAVRALRAINDSGGAGR